MAKLVGKSHRLDIPGDITTPEQYQPSGPRPVPWEACQTLNGSWGYDRDNLQYKTADMVIRMLVDGVAKDGNLLLNVGPTGRGRLGSGAGRERSGAAVRSMGGRPPPLHPSRARERFPVTSYES